MTIEHNTLPDDTIALAWIKERSIMRPGTLVYRVPLGTINQARIDAYDYKLPDRRSIRVQVSGNVGSKEKPAYFISYEVAQ